MQTFFWLIMQSSVCGEGRHDKALRMSALELRLQELQDWEFLSAFQRLNAKQLRESKASD